MVCVECKKVQKNFIFPLRAERLFKPAADREFRSIHCHYFVTVNCENWLNHHSSHSSWSHCQTCVKLGTSVRASDVHTPLLFWAFIKHKTLRLIWHFVHKCHPPLFFSHQPPFLMFIFIEDATTTKAKAKTKTKRFNKRPVSSTASEISSRFSLSSIFYCKKQFNGRTTTAADALNKPIQRVSFWLSTKNSNRIAFN